VWILIIWLVMALVVASVAQTKGRSGLLWFVYGLLLWPIALIAILVLAPNKAKLEQRELRQRWKATSVKGDILTGSIRANDHKAWEELLR
jgi:hypothetical protein